MSFKKFMNLANFKDTEFSSFNLISYIEKKFACIQCALDIQKDRDYQREY